MGTFAQKNGRPPGADQGRPTCDAAYEKVAREFLRQFALDRDEDFAAAVANRFKEAPAKVCCQAIGGWIDERLLAFGWTQHDLADRIGVDRSAVAKWTAGGAISLGHLVLVLLEFGGDFGELPLPARRELALEGYLAALSHVRAKIDPARGREPLDRERFWCLYPSAFRAVLGAGDPAAGPRARQGGGRPSSQARRRVARGRAPACRRGRGPATPGRGVDRDVGDLPRTSTGGLVNTMKTKLETMVAYLAGRKGEATDSIRHECEDPTSEASRCLEVVRLRSRRIFGANLPEMPDPIPSRLILNQTAAQGGWKSAAFAPRRRVVCCGGVDRSGYRVASPGSPPPAARSDARKERGSLG